MKRITLRALISMAFVAGVAALLAQPALAQVPDPPAAKPKCGSVAGLMHHSLAKYVLNQSGRNYVSIQRVSPINASPTNQQNNGFHKICARMGLPYPPSGLPGDMPDIDGDLTPDNAELKQFVGSSGVVNNYRCNQKVSGAQWDEGSAVEIQPQLSNSTSVSLIIPGVECSQKYAAYKGEVNMFPIALSTTCADRICLCSQLNLPYGTKLQTMDAALGNVEDVQCGITAVDPHRTPLPAGEAARIEPTGTGSDGDPVNCVSGTPCPATPNDDYPSPQIY